MSIHPDSKEPERTPTLRELAARRGVLVGTAAEHVPSNPVYSEVLAREFNFVTPENTMKWGVMSKEPGVYNFARADALVDFAREHKQAVHGHTLLFHSQAAPYVLDFSGSRRELIDIVRTHIHTVAGRYRGRVQVWDVVNEVFSEDKQGFRDSPFLQMIGPEFIPMAFRLAREADPRAKLIYNDYGLEWRKSDPDFTYRTFREWLDDGVPLDGIGIQGHFAFDGDEAFDGDYLAEAMGRFADLGLEVYLTEVDFRLPMPATDEMYAAQGQQYYDAMRVCLACPTFRGFQTWGFTDARSWVPGFWKDFGDALPFDREYRAKPAYHGLARALRDG